METPSIDKGEWQKRRYPHAKPDSDSWDIYAGETLIVGDLMGDECDKLIHAHNAALAAERQRSEEAEVLSRGRLQQIERHQQELIELREQLLSALAAIEQINKAVEGKLAPIDVDLSLLHQHDAEVRLPLALALNQIAEGLKGSCGLCQDCHSAKDVAENALLWTSGSDAIFAHDAEVRKPLVEALIEARTWIKSVAPHAPLIKTIDSALAKVKEKP